MQEARPMNNILKLTGGLLLIGAFTTAGWILAQRDNGDDQHQLVKQADDAGTLYYTCAMHPQVRLDHPGHCPICGMALIGKSDTPQAAQAASGGVVAIDPRMAQNLGMRTAEVSTGSSVEVLEAVGSVQVNERSVVTIQSRTAGWIEHLAVNAVGDVVAAGQTLATLYSPELYAAQQELALARSSGDAALVNAAQQRLSLLGGHGGSGAVSALTAPISGVVTGLDVRAGAQLNPGSTLMTLADLDRVWMQIEIPEAQATRLRTGASAEARLSAQPDVVLKGTVDYLYPTLDAQTRTLRARLVLDNPDRLLRPGMFARVAIEAAAGDTTLRVPSEAVIRTGTRTTVIVAEGEGHYRPVDVQAGDDVGDQTVILSGLSAGQRVVVSGQFLIDSEASLQGSYQRMAPHGSAP
jgi:Cu(I)/Ag(I) efflux system membrane fusion protein